MNTTTKPTKTSKASVANYPVQAMNINKVSLGDLMKAVADQFQVQSVVGELASCTRPAHPFEGRLCLARCYSAGVHVGTVKSVEGENVMMENSIRLWSWKAKDGVALSGVAQKGLVSSDSKVDVCNPEIYLTGVCELIPVSAAAEESFRRYL